MIKFKNILSQILLEAPNGSINKRLKDAIINRNPVSFYYNGPKGEVLPGRRVRAELVAMGLTKKGNMVVRGWVQPPSVSKKGFNNSNQNTPEYGWRLFIITRMSGINIYEDETFNQKRPGYNENGDKSLTSIEVKSNWGTLPIPKKEEPKPTVTPTIEPQKTELPQPKPKQKPTTLPQPETKRDIEVYDDLKNKINTVNNKKEITSDDVKLGIDTLYKKKLEDWTKSQSSIGNNTKPGEGTRRRLEKDSEIELFKLLKGDNVNVVTTFTQPEPETDVETDQNALQESLKRIKTLIFF
jgi:hypothetical protein